MSFAMPFLSAFSRQRQRTSAVASLFSDSGVSLPDHAIHIRRSDAHPDAPPRPPVSASRDLGSEALPPVADDVGQADANYPSLYEALEKAEGLSMPRSPEPMPWDAIEQEMKHLIAGVRAHDDPTHEGSASLPSLKDLADRLEQGLERKRMQIIAQADAAPLRPPPPAKATQGLQEALDALRSITANAG